MKIICSKISDLENERDRYDAEVQSLQNKVDEGGKNYRRAIRDKASEIEKTVRDAIGNTSIDLEIDADIALFSRGYYIRIRNEHLHNDKIALSWEWRAELDKAGEVVKSSNSWSGLNATTPEQISNLKETIRVLEKINSLDWSSIIDVEQPNYDEYVDSESGSQLAKMKRERKNYDSLIFNEQLAEFIGSDKFIQVQGAINSNYREGRYTGWVNIISETPSFFNVVYVPDYAKQEIESGALDDKYIDRLSPERCKKDTFYKIVSKPIITWEV